MYNNTGDHLEHNNSPCLVITKQTSISEERVTKRGKTTNVFVVVKNSPFQITIGLKSAPANFNFLAFDMSLWYDMPGMNKEVAYVSTKPIDLKSNINDMGDEISFDVKIKVLSSHHEDNHFRLKILVWDPNNAQFPQLSIFSHPIKVISKPMNQRKPRGTKRTASQANIKQQPEIEPELSNVHLPMIPGPSGIPLVDSPNIEATLSRIDVQQQEGLRIMNEMFLQQQQIQAQLLEQLNYQRQNPAKRMKLSDSESTMSGLLSGESCSTSTTASTADLSLSVSDSKCSGDFERSFSSMLKAYTLMSAEEKAEKLRKVLRSFSQRDLGQLEEMIDVMATTGVKPQFGNPSFNQPVDFGHSDACAEDCPHRVELSRMDQFYSEAFLQF